jgi:hypothetical protein
VKAIQGGVDDEKQKDACPLLLSLLSYSNAAPGRMLIDHSLKRYAKSPLWITAKGTARLHPTDYENYDMQATMS